MRALPVQLIKSIPDIIAKIVLPPAISITFIPARQPTLIQLDLLPHRERKSLVQLKLVGQPSRYPISTELLSNQILMEIDQRVDAMLSGHIDQSLHCIQVSLIIGIFLWLDARPHHAEPNAVVAPFCAVDHVLL